MDGNFGGHLLFGAIGLPLLLLGFVLARQSFRLNREGIRASAVVVAYQSDSESTWPVVEFDDRAGKRHRVQLSCSAGPPVGEAMEVVYERHCPENVVGHTIAHLWMGPLTATGLGSFFVAQVGQVYGMLDLEIMATAALGVVILLASAWLDSMTLGGSSGKKPKGPGRGVDGLGADLAEPID